MNDNLIFIMGIPISEKTIFILKQGPCFYLYYQVRQKYAYNMVQPLPKPMMTYYELNIKEQILVFFIIKLTIFFQKCIPNCLQILVYFIQVSMS